jgi:hypothetical protein
LLSSYDRLDLDHRALVFLVFNPHLLERKPDAGRVIVGDDPLMSQSVDDVLAPSCEIVRVEHPAGMARNADCKAVRASFFIGRRTLQCSPSIVFNDGVRWPGNHSFKAGAELAAECIAFDLG